MNSNNAEILLSINLQAGTVLRNSKYNTLPLSVVTNNTKIGAQFLQNAIKNDSFGDACLSRGEWFKMNKGQRINAMIKTIVADTIHLPVERIITNVHFKYEVIE